jgi:hypothetical protein
MRGALHRAEVNGGADRFRFAAAECDPPITPEGGLSVTRGFDNWRRKYAGLLPLR